MSKGQRNRNGRSGQGTTPTQGYVPLRIDTTGPKVEEERIPLFYIDDEEFTGPARISAATALKALEVAYENSVPAAAFWCLIEAIGEDGYKALTERAAEYMEFEQAQDLMNKIKDMYFGQALDVAGK